MSFVVKVGEEYLAHHGSKLSLRQRDAFRFGNRGAAEFSVLVLGAGSVRARIVRLVPRAKEKKL